MPTFDKAFRPVESESNTERQMHFSIFSKESESDPERNMHYAV